MHGFCLYDQANFAHMAAPLLYTGEEVMHWPSMLINLAEYQNQSATPSGCIISDTVGLSPMYNPQILSFPSGYDEFHHTTSEDNGMNCDGSIDIERPYDADGQVYSKSAYSDEDYSDEGAFA